MEKGVGQTADTLVKEYLLSRGLVDTFDAFVTESHQQEAAYHVSVSATSILRLEWS